MQLLMLRKLPCQITWNPIKANCLISKIKWIWSRKNTPCFYKDYWLPRSQKILSNLLWESLMMFLVPQRNWCLTTTAWNKMLYKSIKCFSKLECQKIWRGIGLWDSQNWALALKLPILTKTSSNTHSRPIIEER